MASINKIDDLFIHFNINIDCKIKINQLYNTHKNKFLSPFIAICKGIKTQNLIILDNQYEHPKEIFYVKTPYMKVVYKKENLEIFEVDWIENL